MTTNRLSEWTPLLECIQEMSDSLDELHEFKNEIKEVFTKDIFTLLKNTNQEVDKYEAKVDDLKEMMAAWVRRCEEDAEFTALQKELAKLTGAVAQLEMRICALEEKKN